MSVEREKGLEPRSLTREITGNKEMKELSREGFQCVRMLSTRSYVLPCDGGYLLIDTTYTKDHRKFLKALVKLGIKLLDIRYVLLTHHHNDHAGLVTQLTGQCGALVISHKNAVEQLRKGENKLGNPVNRRVKPLISLAKLFGAMSSFPPVVLRDEDLVVTSDDDGILRSIGIEGRILCTPGHTQDSISVMLDDGNAFVGDIAFNNLKFAGTKYRPLYIDSLDELFDSWRKILNEGAKTVYPVHGKPFPAERLGSYLD